MQRGIIGEIMRLREKLGFAVIFITYHDLPMLIEISDRLASTSALAPCWAPRRIPRTRGC